MVSPVSPVVPTGLTYHCPAARKRATVWNYVGDGVTYGYRLLRASGKFIVSCPAGDETRNSFIIERVSGAEVFDGISVFR